jgi:hypothetical protein
LAEDWSPVEERVNMYKSVSVSKTKTIVNEKCDKEDDLWQGGGLGDGYGNPNGYPYFNELKALREELDRTKKLLSILEEDTKLYLENTRLLEEHLRNLIKIRAEARVGAQLPKEGWVQKYLLGIWIVLVLFLLVWGFVDWILISRV